VNSKESKALALRSMLDGLHKRYGPHAIAMEDYRGEPMLVLDDSCSIASISSILGGYRCGVRCGVRHFRLQGYPNFIIHI
jgi:hypothetical protein